MKSLTILLAVLALILSACTTVEAGGEALTIPSKWNLESFGKTGAETPVIEGSTVTIEFNEEGQLGGSGGCNSYGATFEVEGNKITISDVISTLMACTDSQVMEQETQFFSALQNAVSFDLSGDSLTIFYDGGESQLKFVKQ